MAFDLEQALSRDEQPNIGTLAAEAHDELTYAAILNALFTRGHKQVSQQQAVFNVLYRNKSKIVRQEEIIREALETDRRDQNLYENLLRVVIGRLRAGIKGAGLGHVLSIGTHAKLGYVLIVGSKENLAILPHEAKDVAALSQMLKGKMHLTPSELKLFEALLKGYCTVQTNEQLYRKVWEAESGAFPLRVNVSRLKANLDAAGLGETYQIVNFQRIGYALYLNTPEGLVRLASIREKPLHEAENVAVLTQVSMLNNIRLSFYPASYLFALLRMNGQIVEKSQLGLEVYGDTSQREASANEKITRVNITILRRAIEGREINGFQYQIETHLGKGYSIHATKAD